jgi:TonB family protein
VTAPDWSDFHIYPQAAAALSQEGRVRIALRVSAEGQPQACRVTQSSGHAELDDGTCDLGMAMRYAPMAGASAETFAALSLNWQLTDPVPLGPVRTVAHLDLTRGRVTACRLDPGDGVPEGWTRNLCPIFANQSGYFLGAARARARHASIVVSLRATGDSAPPPAPPSGDLVAGSRTLFELTAEGAFKNCRTSEAHGLGNRRDLYAGPCGLILTSLWLEPEANPNAPHGGSVDVSVYVEP